MANDGTVFAPVGLSIPSVLDTPPSESKLWPALCRRDRQECISDVSGGIPFACL